MPQAALRQISRPCGHAGLLIGVELRQEALPVVLRLVERGVLVFPSGSHVIRVYPPLVIEDELVDRVAAAIVEATAD